jgi:hypothetical protein
VLARDFRRKSEGFAGRNYIKLTLFLLPSYRISFMNCAAMKVAGQKEDDEGIVFV